MKLKAASSTRHKVTLACGHKRLIHETPGFRMACLECMTTRDVVKSIEYRPPAR